MTQTEEVGGPYESACGRYWTVGWLGVLPLPARAKKWPPKGWTGAEGGWPSRADLTAWATGPEGSGNLALRLPRDVIGLDVDNYAGKRGAEALALGEQQWGPLPPTWRSTSRDDGVSGIRLYRVPEGLAWPGELGPGTEIIQYRHRYVVAWPSIHPEGRVYRWITPDGATAAAVVPQPNELPELPDPWIEGLTGGRLETDVPKADLDDMEAVTWLVQHGAGEQCGLMSGEVDRYISSRFSDHASRHDAAKDATARLTHLAAEGHRGAHLAIEEIRNAFIAATQADPSRMKDSGEWKRLLTGAIRMAAVDMPNDVQPADPCDAVTVLDLSILEDAPADPSQTITDARARALEAEVNVQRLRREAKRVLDEEEAKSAFRVPPYLPTLTDELAVPDDPVTYLVESVMPRGANVLLAAQYKTGKTTMVNALTRSLVDGAPFLGKFNVAPIDGRVALFNYEVDSRQYRRWMREVGIANTDSVVLLNLRGYRLPVTAEAIEDWVVAWLIEREVKVWVVDPFARAFVGSGASENDNTEVGRFLDTLDVIKERSGVGELILPTHTGRAEAEVGQERARGATRLDDWADVRWMLTKDQDDVRYFSATGRDVEVEEAALKFDEPSRSPVVAGESRARESNRRVTDAVASVIEASPGINTRHMRVAVRQILRKVTNGDIDDAITRLEIDRRIRIDDGSRGAHLHFLAAPTVLVHPTENDRGA